MTRFRWPILIAVGGAVLVFLLLLVFRSSGSTEAQPEQKVPVPGGEYSEALVGALQRLNPVFDFRNSVDRDVDRLVFSGLLKYDSSGAPQPDLAQGWVVSDDGTSYTLLIRPDAVWQDGQPVTTRDVVYTFSLLQSVAYPGPTDLGTLWRSVKVESLSDKLVRFTLPEAYAPFLDFLTIGLLPDHILHGIDIQQLDTQTFNLQPVGTGPFRVGTLKTSGNNITGVELTPFDKFYGSKPFLEKITFQYFPTQQAALDALASGAVQGLGGIPVEALPTVLANSHLQTHTARLPDTTIAFLNLKSDDVKFFQDREVRTALMLAIDRQHIIDSQLDGQAVMASGPILPGNWAADPSLHPGLYDPEQAVRLLDGDGWKLPVGATLGTDSYVRAKEKIQLAFTMVVPEGTLQEDIAKEIQKAWAVAGVKCNLKIIPMPSLLSDYLGARVYQAALVDLNLSPYPDPDPYPFWSQTQFPGGQNYSQFDDRSISETLELARTSNVLADRVKYYRNFQYRFNYLDPALILWHPVYTYAVDSRILGISIGPLYDDSDRLADANLWYMNVVK